MRFSRRPVKIIRLLRMTDSINEIATSRKALLAMTEQDKSLDKLSSYKRKLFCRGRNLLHPIHGATCHGMSNLDFYPHPHLLPSSEKERILFPWPFHWKGFNTFFPRPSVGEVFFFFSLPWWERRRWGGRHFHPQFVLHKQYKGLF